MPEPANPPKSVNRMDALLALAAGAVAFLVYLATLSPGIYPGQSALLLATCSGAEPLVAPTHPVWMSLSAWICGWHGWSLATRMNLFSALCGALAVGMIYRIMSHLVRETIYDATISDLVKQRASILAGLVSAAALAFSVPFWSASTRFHYQSFDLLLLLSVFYLLVIYAKSGRTVFLMLFACCYGIGMVESTMFLMSAPAAGAFTLYVLWRRKRLTHSLTIVGTGLALLLGLLAYVFFAWNFCRTEDIALRGYRGLMDVLVFMWRDQFQELREGFSPGWILLAAQSVVPAVAALIASRRTLNNERSWSFYLLHAILLGVAVCVLTNMPFTPWRLAKPSGLLPVAVCAMMAMVTGYLAVYWYLLKVVTVKRHDQMQLPTITRRAGDWMGRILFWPFLALVLVTAAINAFEANGRAGAGADACAQAILDRMGDRPWIVTDGMLDNHLLVLARERGKPLHLLCLQKDQNPVYQHQLGKTIEQENLFGGDRPRMLNTLKLGVLPFIQDWFASDPDIARKAVVFGVPDLWYAAGLIPVPDAFFFAGARTLEGLNGGALAADHLALWNRMDRLLPRKADAAAPADLLRNELRRHLGFIGNNLGVTLEEMGRTNDAVVVYERVRKLDPGNISALFNQFEMARRSGDEARRQRVEKELHDFIGQQKRQYPLWSLSRYYGYIRSPELFARMAGVWALSGQPQAALVGVTKAAQLQLPNEPFSLEHTKAAIYLLQEERGKSAAIYQGILDKNPNDRQAIRSMARFALAEGSLDQARGWLDRMQKTGVTRSQLGVEWAAVHMAAGDFDRARLQLQETVDLQPNNLQALGMLAVVHLQQAEVARAAGKDPAPMLKEVDQVILPRMDAVGGSQDQYFYLIVKGQLNVARGKDFFRPAREAFIRAGILRPDVARLQDIVLQLDIALVDPASAERHARAVLRNNRKHALANYVMGSLRLQSGDYGEAEDFLRRSVESEPLPAALNDLAETLRRIRKLVPAESYARAATVKAPGLYVAWETLASVLMDLNRLDEAEEALKHAVNKSKEDMRVQMSMARLQLMKGDGAKAREIVKQVRARQGELSAYERQELEKIAAEAARRR